MQAEENGWGWVREWMGLGTGRERKGGGGGGGEQLQHLVTEITREIKELECRQRRMGSWWEGCGWGVNSFSTWSRKYAEKKGVGMHAENGGGRWGRGREGDWNVGLS